MALLVMPKRAEVLAQLLRQSDQRVLGRRVGLDAGQAWAQPRARGDEDEAAIAAALHDGRGRLREPERAVDVGLEDRAPRRLVDLLDRPPDLTANAAGGTDQNIEPTIRAADDMSTRCGRRRAGRDRPDDMRSRRRPRCEPTRSRRCPPGAPWRPPPARRARWRGRCPGAAPVTSATRPSKRMCMCRSGPGRWRRTSAAGRPRCRGSRRQLGERRRCNAGLARQRRR